MDAADTSTVPRIVHAALTAPSGSAACAPGIIAAIIVTYSCFTARNTAAAMRTAEPNAPFKM